MLGFDDWIGWLSCSEHGAYVVITAEDRPQWAPFAEEGHYSNHQPGFHGTTVYRFEEDCD